MKFINDDKKGDDSMNRKTKVLIGIAAVFIVAMTLSVAFAGSSDAKTFKTSSGWEWKINGDKWETMKMQASDKYDEMKRIGSSYPGYSDTMNITVTKGGQTRQGIAMAVKNDNGIRCEVRGVLANGERLTVDEIKS